MGDVDETAGASERSHEHVISNEERESGSNRRLLLPNTTQVPNVILDRWLAVMSGAKVKVVLYVARRTYGFGRTSDRISVRQMVDGIVKRDGTRLDYGTGLGRSTVIATVDELVREGVLIKHESKAPSGADRAAEVSLNMSYEAPPPSPRRARKRRATSKGTAGGAGVQGSDPPSPRTVPSPSRSWTPGVQKADLQNKVDHNLVVGNSEESINRRASGKEPPLKSWQALATEVERVCEVEIGHQAARIADQLATLVDVQYDHARRLAKYCVDRGEEDMLMRVALRVAQTEPTYPWPALLTAIVNAREEEGGRRKSQVRRESM